MQGGKVLGTWGKVGAGRGGLSPHTHVHLIYSWQFSSITVSSSHLSQNIQGSAHAAAWWGGQPPRLHPEFWGNSRTSGTLPEFRSGQKACHCSGSWEPDPGQMDVEVKQEATIGSCFERHLSRLSPADSVPAAAGQTPR